jgi:putrescine transport system permease protein
VLALPWAWLGLFLLAPAAIVLKISLAAPADAVPPYTALLHWGAGWLPQVAISLDSYALILGDPLYLHALLLSVKVAGISTLA